MLGIEQIIVVVTKIDLIDYSEAKINRLIQDLHYLLLEIGFKERNVSIV
jgi:translation elongation factor EF-1alpha